MVSLESKVAVVTGGDSGIGLAAARQFAEEGAQVVITGRDETTLEAARKEIGHDVVALRLDASDLEHVMRLVDIVAARFGRIDTLFLNAGDTTVRGPYFMIQHALPLLARGASVILNAAFRSLARTLSAELVSRGIRMDVIGAQASSVPVTRAA